MSKQAKQKLLVERGWMVKHPDGGHVFLGGVWPLKEIAIVMMKDEITGPFKVVPVEVRELPAKRKAKR